jgi:hypothetical protein
MTVPDHPADCQALWQELLDADQKLHQAQNDLFTHCQSTLVELIRAGLDSPQQRRVAFRIASLIYDTEQRKVLFRDFLALACQPSYIPTVISAREAILPLPRDWVRSNIEREAAEILDWDDGWEHPRYLELCTLIDKDLTIRAAQKAAKHEDPDIREAGEQFLKDPNPVAGPEKLKHPGM